MRIPFVSGAWKAGVKILDHPIAAGAWFAMSATNTAKSAISTTMDGVHDANTIDPNTFERFGQGVGQTMADGISAGFDAAFLIHGTAAHWGGQAHHDAYKFFNKSLQRNDFYMKEGENMFQLNGTSKFGGALSKTEAAMIEEKGMAGVMKNSGRFVRNPGMKLMAGMFVAPLMMSMLVTPILGAAGKVMDAAYEESRKRREVNYDHRYIVNQKQDMSTMQSVGAAMDSYQNKMMSMSRIYHSR